MANEFVNKINDIDNDVPNYSCGNCIHFSHTKPTCKRIDHETVRFAKPWFASYDRNQYNGTVCSDFEPGLLCVDGRKRWNGFDDYWNKFVEQWLPYSNTDTGIGFTLHGKTDVRYKVKLLDYVYGRMIDGNILKAYEKVYYKRSKESSTGYILVHEPIDGVQIII